VDEERMTFYDGVSAFEFSCSTWTPSVIKLLRYSTYKIYKVLQYAIAQECQQNVNRQWSYASLKNLTWLDDKCSFG